MCNKSEHSMVQEIKMTNHIKNWSYKEGDYLIEYFKDSIYSLSSCKPVIGRTLGI